MNINKYVIRALRGFLVGLGSFYFLAKLNLATSFRYTLILLAGLLITDIIIDKFLNKTNQGEK